ncbi:MAG: hypothetical protein U0W24_01035 [Bacteroidales bacterium]
MYCLDDNQLATVTRDVEKEGINFSHLSTDLVDHICCEIENYMYQGISFSESYDLVKKKFGIKGLRQIQQDTLLLIDKNYRIMKNSMKTIGTISLAVMAFGVLFKIMHWPYSGILLVFGFIILALLFLPALLYVMYRDVNQKKHLVVYIAANLGGIVFLAGVLFKIMHWPYAQFLFFPGLAMITYLLIPLIIYAQILNKKTNQTVLLTGLISLMVVLTGLLFKINHWPFSGHLLIIGSVFLVLVFLPLYYMLEISKSNTFRADFVFGIIAMAFFIIFTFLQSLPKDYGVFDQLAPTTNSYKESAAYLQKKNFSITEKTKNKILKSLSSQADLTCNKMEDIKVQIVMNYLNVPAKKAIDLLNSNSFYGGSENDVSFLLPEFNDQSSLIALKKEINQFKELYTILSKDSNGNQLFDTGRKFIPRLNKQADWEEYCLMEYQPDPAINAISLWQLNIRLAEYKAISEYLKSENIEVYE